NPARRIWTIIATGSARTPPDARPPDTGAERDQQQDDRAEEDDVAEPGVEAEPVVEGLLVDELERVVVRRPVLEFVVRIERPLPRGGDLRDDGKHDERRPVAIDRSERLHARRV